MPVTAFRNVFAGNPLDRATGYRSDTAWLTEQVRKPHTRFYALWNGSVLVDGQPVALAQLDPGLARRLGQEDGRLLFLGRDAGGTAAFALDVDGPADPTLGPLEGRGRFEGLRDLAPVLTADEAAIAATARALFEWGRRTRFCPACGSSLAVLDGGWRRICTACGTEQFPRTDPVVIMLPVRGESCLLGRQASWTVGRYSALAGFMEPGESIEEACAREVAEEVGLSVAAVRYHSSQPWPFPANLMIGLIADVETGEAHPADSELEAVRWVTRGEIRSVLTAESDDGAPDPGDTPSAQNVSAPPDLSLPPPLAIARRLIESWATDYPAKGPAGQGPHSPR